MIRLTLPAAAVLMLVAPLASQAATDQPKPKAQAAPKAPAEATSQAMPAMTPEQMAEMEAYMKAATPGKEHAALAAQAGTYDAKVKSWQAPGTPAMESIGTETRTMILGGRVLVSDVSCSMMGMPFDGHGMTGYDNVSGKYWGTWNDSMGTGLMISEGTCDANNACTFHATWNDPIKKGPMTARMMSRWTSPTVEIFEMYGPGKDGKEFQMMEITYKKK